jgi:hypothetical protein
MRKQKILRSIEVLPQQNAIQVAWDNQIIDDDDVTVLSTTIERCAYMSSQKDQFVSEVDGAAAYVDLIVWGADS